MALMPRKPPPRRWKTRSSQKAFRFFPFSALWCASATVKLLVMRTRVLVVPRTEAQVPRRLVKSLGKVGR